MRSIIGIDEAGRGPLAGPVAVGLIRAAEDFDLLTAFPGLNDSKKLSEKNRERIFELLQERVAAGDISYLVAMPTAQHIDRYGITGVIRSAITTGLSKLITEREHHKVWLDGSLSAPSEYEQETVIGGDSLVPAIMLASVAAKVTRDRLMIAFAKKYPEYGFERHKGYGTRSHMTALREHGLCAIHRSSFIHLDQA